MFVTWSDNLKNFILEETENDNDDNNNNETGDFHYNPYEELPWEPYPEEYVEIKCRIT